MSLLLEPLLKCTPQMQKRLLNFAMESAGAQESALRLLAEYQQFDADLRLVRFWKRLKRNFLRPFGSRHKS